MKKNVGTVDQWIRIVLGVVLVGMAVFLTGGIRWVGLLGLILLATAVFRFCPLYALLGVHTNKDA